MKKSCIIGIAGRIGSGKDEVEKITVKKFGFKPLSFSKNVLDPMLKEHGKIINRSNQKFLSMKLRKGYGNGILAKILLKKIKQGRNYVINGFRYPEEIGIFKENFSNCFIMIGVECPRRIRYERVKMRGRSGEGQITWKEFIKMDSAVNEVPIDKILRKVDIKIANEKDLHCLKNELKVLKNNILLGGLDK